MRCGQTAVHTADDRHPLCDFCTQVRVLSSLLWDITEGKVTVPPSDEDEE